MRENEARPCLCVRGEHISVLVTISVFDQWPGNVWLSSHAASTLTQVHLSGRVRALSDRCIMPDYAPREPERGLYRLMNRLSGLEL